MKTCLVSATLAIAAIASPAAAQSSEKWHVEGAIGDKHFTLNCRFDRQNTRVGGECVEVEGNGKAGKHYTLSRGSINGAAITWTYPIKVMFMSVNLDFAGQIRQSRMAGTVTAKGRSGTFSATRI